MKIMVISPKNKTTFNFRGDLIRHMISLGNEVVAIGPDKQFVDDIIALGVSKFIEIPFVKDNTSAFGDIKYCQHLKKVIKEEKPDMVFGYTIKPVIYGTIAAHRAGVKKIFPMVTGLGRVYASQSIKTRVIRMLTKILYKKAFKYCDKVIFQNTDDIKQFVNDGYLPAYKAYHIDGSGVSLDRFKRPPLPDEQVFLMTARIIKEKGVFEYINAAKIVKEKHSEARFILLGGFDSSIGAIKPEDIQPFIDDKTIEFPGEVKDVAPILASARYFVLPTFYREGLPRTILEAMAMGKPVITTDWPGCRDAVKDGENGFLVQINDFEALAEKMITLIEDGELAQKMSDDGYNKCCKIFDVNIINKKMGTFMELENTYKKALIVATVQSHIAQFHRPLINLLNENGYEVHVAGNDNLLLKNGLKINGAEKIYNVPFARDPKAPYKEALAMMKDILNTEHYDIVVCNTPMGGILTRLAAKKVRKHCGTKVFYMAHGFHFYLGGPRQNWLIYYPIEKHFAKKCDTVITITDEDYNLASKKFKADIKHVHGVGVNSEKYSTPSKEEIKNLREALGFKNNDFVILCVGELNLNKNQRVAVETVSGLIKDYPNIKLLLAGNGDADKELKELVKEKNVENNIIFLGYVTDLERYVKMCDMAISCSIREGLPVNVMEAMLCSKPFVASINRGHKELVEDGKTGYLLEYNDIVGFENAIKKLINNPQLKEELGKNGYEKVQKYTDVAVEKELKQIYGLK